MTRILVTGAKGFVGATLVRRLHLEGHDVMCLDLPHVEADSLKTLGATGTTMYDGDVADAHTWHFDVNPELVIHLAAEAIMSAAQSDPVRTFRTNVVGAVNVLEWCRKNDVPAIVASSDKAYGSGTSKVETDPLRPEYIYDTSKTCEDIVAQGYAKTYGLPVTITRMCNVYGPGDLNWTRLIPKTVRNALQGKPAVIYKGATTVMREYIHVDDVCEAYLLLAKFLLSPAKQGRANGPFNVGTGVVLYPHQVVEFIQSSLGLEHLPTEIVESVFEELSDQSLNSEKLRKLGWRPRIDFPEGIAETVKWYRGFLEDQ